MTSTVRGVEMMDSDDEQDDLDQIVDIFDQYLRDVGRRRLFRWPRS